MTDSPTLGTTLDPDEVRVTVRVEHYRTGLTRIFDLTDIDPTACRNETESKWVETLTGERDPVWSRVTVHLEAARAVITTRKPTA